MKGKAGFVMKAVDTIETAGCPAASNLAPRTV